MILQALNELYERREQSVDPGSRPPPAGFELKEIPFVLEIDAAGGLTVIHDTRRIEGKKKIAKAERVPQGVKKTSGVAANLLWDTSEYVLGIDTRGNPERVCEQHAAFCSRVAELAEVVGEDAGLSAVLKFLDRIDAAALSARPEWKELYETNPLLSFRLQSDTDLVCQRPAIVAACSARAAMSQADGLCLITGEAASIERLHTAIKGVWGAQSSGANIVSFNLDAFNSYGKNQGANAPVGKPAANRYTTALNDLLKRGSRQRIQVGDASTVFWAERGNEIENDFGALFGEPAKDNPELNTDRVKALYEAVRSGKYVQDRSSNERFYILGLAPNAARVAVRFWHVDTVGAVAGRIAQHFADLDIVHAPHEPPFLSLFRLLSSCAVQGKADNIPPNLGGEVMRAILEGLPYPQTLLQAAVRRCTAERSVNYPRAAIIKACINRIDRSRRIEAEELHMSLDPSNKTPSYLLGRLFMVLEQIQKESMGDINRTIRDTYWASSLATPRRSFPLLIDLSHKHLKKLRREKPGRATNLERLQAHLVGSLGADDPFPNTLPSEEHGRFIVGYYHQRQDEGTYKSQGAINEHQ